MILGKIFFAVGDFNEDGKPDLAVLLDSSNSNNSFVSILLNQTTFPPPVAHFSVTIPASVLQGINFNVTVNARDQSNNTAAAYRGTVHFTSTDQIANLPGDYTFTNVDHGAHTFSLKFNTVGARQLFVTDKNKGSIQGSAFTNVIGPHYSVQAPATVNAGSSFSVTVIAVDPGGSPLPNYIGTAHITSSDTNAMVPPDAALTNGFGTFNLTLKTAGGQTVSAIDTANLFTNGTSGVISVNPGPANRFSLTVPIYVSQGSTFAFTATARDQFNNVASSYTGTAHFTSSDGAAVLPGDYTFTGADQGSHTFTGATTLNTLGNQTISATDKSNGTITETSSNIYVSGTTLATVTLTLTGIAPAPTRSLFRKAITFTATTNPTNATGTILLMDGATVIGSGILASGSTTITTVIGTVGSHSLTALYSGDATYSTAMSTALVLARSPKPR
jgi:hypothetical protein